MATFECKINENTFIDLCPKGISHAFRNLYDSPQQDSVALLMLPCHQMRLFLATEFNYIFFLIFAETC